MGRHTLGRRRNRDQRRAPSKLFLIALGIGVILLLFVAYQIATTPIAAP